MEMETKDFLKAMENGLIFPLESLPKLAALMRKKMSGELDTMTKNFNADLRRLTNAFNDFKRESFDAGLGPGLQFLFGALENLMFMLQPVANFLSGVFHRALWLVVTPIELAVAYMADFANWLGITEESMKSNGANVAMWLAAIAPAAFIFLSLFKIMKLFGSSLMWLGSKLLPFGKAGGIFATAFGARSLSGAAGGVGRVAGSLGLLFGRFIPFVGTLIMVGELLHALGATEWAKSMYEKAKPFFDKIGAFFEGLRQKLENLFNDLSNKTSLIQSSQERDKFIKETGDRLNPYNMFVPPTVSDSATSVNKSNNQPTELKVTKSVTDQEKGEIKVIFNPSNGAEKFVDTRVEANLQGWRSTVVHDISED